MNLYIHSAGIVSAAGDNSQEDFLKDEPEYNTDRLLCKEPDYSGYIPPMQLRRMSKAVRMAIGASKICLNKAGIEKPDAISIGTAMGCLQDTEVFLSKMVDQQEQMLTPTAFIQSTHNTVGGQIALLTGCHGHNLTIVHRGHSFEQAMTNAWLYLGDHPGEKVLVGGIDELTETSFEIMKMVGVYRQDPSTAESVLQDNSDGSIAGEGAGFFIVSDQPSGEGNLLIKAIRNFETKDYLIAMEQVEDFLSDEKTDPALVDLALLGINGDDRSHLFYKLVSENLFEDRSVGTFKHLSGEYPTASAFGLGILAHAIETKLPGTVILNKAPEQMKQVVMINNFMNHYSCWLLEVQ